MRAQRERTLASLHNQPVHVVRKDRSRSDAEEGKHGREQMTVKIVLRPSDSDAAEALQNAAASA